MDLSHLYCFSNSLAHLVYLRTFVRTRTFRLLSVFLLALTLGLATYFIAAPEHVKAAISAGYSEYYISGPSDQLWAIFEDIDNDPDLVEANGMRTIIAVTAASDNTTIYYDHWEDGYDVDPLSPGGTSEVYVINEGQAQEFESFNIPVMPRGSSRTACGAASLPIANVCYDGRDHIYTAGGPVVVTVANWPESIGTVFSLAWEVLPTKPYRVNYTIPVGENLDGAPYSYDDFSQVFVIVQSAYDTNTVTIDDPKTAGVEVNVVLNEGEVTQLAHIDAGTVVSSTLPVQVQFIVGDGPHGGQASEIRGYSALPSPLWDNEYYNPVGGFSAGDTDLYIYNPSTSAITINYEDSAGSGSFNLPGNSTLAYSDGAAAGRTVPLNSGVYLSSTSDFWAIGSGDAEGLNYDWGYSLVPAYILSDEYYLGWAPGSNENTPTVNGSPVFVTPVQDGTFIYVDYSPTDGAVDVTYTLDHLETQKIFDPDNENTGMHIWASGPIALAWGEDPDTAAIGNPYLDLGYTTLPLPIEFMDVTLGVTKTVEPTNLPPGAGQVATFTIQMPVYALDSGQSFTMTSLVMTDTLPAGWAYNPGSTTITLPDASQIFSDPVINGQELFWDFGGSQNMNPNDTITVVFEALTTASTPSGFNENCAEGQGTIGSDTFNARDCILIYIGPLTIDKDTGTPSVVAGGVATYTIVLDNIDNLSVITDVTVADTLPTGFTYAGSNVTISSGSNVTRTSSSDPTVGDSALSWGTWDIGPLEALTITFSVDVAGAVSAGTYDNTADASYQQGGMAVQIDDAGTAGQDTDTPSGGDPETDEDITITPPMPDLSLVKASSANGGPVNPGATITYTIVVANHGPGLATGIVISDTLPAGTNYVANSATVTAYMLFGETVGDAFNAIAFTGNQDSNGAADPTWIGDWIEVGEADGAGANDVQVINDISNYQLRLGDNDSGGEGVYRDVDLSDCATATLSFVYRRQGLDTATDYVRLSIGTGGALTVNLNDFAGPTNDGSYQPYSVDISNWVGAQTRIQLLTSASMGATDYIYFDDISIDCALSTIVTNPGGAPPNLVTASDGYSLQSGQTMTVTFLVTVSNPAGVSNIANTAAVTSTEIPTPVTGTVTDTVAGPTGTVFGHLYLDTNGNGAQDLGEPDLANVDVIITDSNGVMQTVTTDANGDWTATVPPGSTTADVDESDPQYPTGYTQTEGTDPTTVTAVAGANTDAGIDGYYPPIDLSLAKTVDDVTPGIGQNIAYTIVLTNAGPNNATNVTIEDVLPGGVTYMASVANQGTYNSSTNIWDVGLVLTGNTYMLTISATVNSAGIFTNTAQVETADQGDTDSIPGNNDPSEDDQDEVTITVAENPVIGLAKSVSNTANNGDGTYNVNYTLVVENLGDVLLSNVLITDDLSITFAGSLGFSVISGPAATSPLNANPGYNGASDIDLLTGSDTLAVSEVATITFTVLVTPGTNLGPYTNTATAEGASPTGTPVTDDSDDGTDPDPDGDGDPDEPGEGDPTPVTFGLIDLQISKTDGGATTSAGGVVAYTLSFTNTGNLDATGVVITETVPANTTFNPGPSTAGWTCLPDNSAGSACTLSVGMLSANGGAGSATFAITVDDPLPASVTQIANSALIEDDGSNGPDDNPADNTASDTTPIAVLEVSKLVSVAAAAPTQVVTYTILVTNTGSVVMNPVVVTDTMSAGLSYVSGSAAPPPTLQNGQQLIWADATAGAGLAPGGTLQLTFLAQVTTTIGLYDNVVVVEAVHPGGTITDTDSAPVGVDDPAVEVSKRVNAPGAVNGLITFTIDITNTGPSVLDVLPLFDTFSGPVEYVGGTPQANIVDNTNQAIAWNDLTGPAPNGFGQNLAPGQSVTILTIFRITTGAAEFSMVNQAAVSNAIDEFNNPANDDDDTAALTNVPTAVDLLYFNAEWQSNAVRLTWATAVEIDNFGFRLLRSSTGNLADAAEIAFIPGAGHGLQNGQTYAYDDAAAQPGQSYTYWLVDIDLSGIETVHGPASVAAINTGGGNFNFKLYVPFVSR